MTSNGIPLIFVVDNDADFVEIARARLERDGIKVAIFYSGEHALNHVLSERPAVIISDIEMPDLSGIDVARQALLRLPSSRIILVSGSRLSEDGERLLRAYPRHLAYLQKPFPLTRLRDAVEEMLVGWRHKA